MGGSYDRRRVKVVVVIDSRSANKPRPTPTPSKTPPVHGILPPQSLMNDNCTQMNKSGPCDKHRVQKKERDEKTFKDLRARKETKTRETSRLPDML